MGTVTKTARGTITRCWLRRATKLLREFSRFGPTWDVHFSPVQIIATTNDASKTICADASFWALVAVLSFEICLLSDKIRPATATAAAFVSVFDSSSGLPPGSASAKFVKVIICGYLEPHTIYRLELYAAQMPHCSWRQSLVQIRTGSQAETSKVMSDGAVGILEFCVELIAV